MDIVIRDEVKEVLDCVGVTNIAALVEDEAVMMLLAKESKYQAEYNKFKDKYKSDFIEFEKTVHSSGKEDFEIEDDLMDWEFVYHALENIKKKKRLLRV